MILGITGGIGSGKSTVCRIFELFGVPVYDSDARAKAIMVEDTELIQGLKDTFGNETYFEDGSLNRKYLAAIVFNNQEKLNQLNGWVHPAVGRDFYNWKSNQSAGILIKEAAILIESGAYKTVDKIIVVDAPQEVRLNRVLKRDGSTKAEVLARMSKQLSDEERKNYADFVIDNSGEQLLIPQVKSIVDQLKNQMRS